MARTSDSPEQSPTKPSPSNSVPAVERAAAILEFLMRSIPAAPSLSEIHRRLGINKSTAHAILGTLAKAGLAERRFEGGGWSLGPKTLELGLSYNRASPAFSLFSRVGGAIREASRESVFYAVLRGRDVLFLSAAEERSHALIIDMMPGDSVPAIDSALGRALLCGRPETETRALLETGTDADRARIDAFIRDAARAAREGYAFTNEEGESGICGIAAPVRDRAGTVIAAIGMAVPASRMNLERRAELAALLMRGAAELGAGAAVLDRSARVSLP